MKKSLMIPVMVILFSQFVFAQNPEWIHYPQGGNIWALAVELDSNGKNIIWMRGRPGVTTFDGTNWTTYDSTITGFLFAPNSIRFDSKGNVWMGNTNGLVKYDRKNWIIYNTSNSQAPSNILPFIDITPDDVILIGSLLWGRQAYCEFDGVDQWTLFDTTQIPAALRVWNVLHEPGTNNRWIGCFQSLGAVLYNGNEFKIYSTTNSGISANSIFGLAIDKHHNKYFGPEGSIGISKLDSTNKFWTVYGPSLYAAHDMVIDKEGNLWWVAAALYKATKDFKEVTVWNSINSPLTGSARKIVIDSNGNKWIGASNGLYVFNEGGIVNIGDDNINVPESFMLYQNSPNPFNPQTLIRLDVTQSQYAKLKIYNSIGQHVSTIVDRTLSPGKYEFLWDGMGFTSGIYFYTLEIDNKIQTRKMILLR